MLGRLLSAFWRFRLGATVVASVLGGLRRALTRQALVQLAALLLQSFYPGIDVADLGLEDVPLLLRQGLNARLRLLQRCGSG